MRYQTLIRRERRELRRRIRATRQPIFNLVRLLRGPCTLVGCKGGHRPPYGKFYRNLVSSFTFVLLLMLGADLARGRHIGYGMMILLGVFVLAFYDQWAYVWKKHHRDQVKEMRQELECEDNDARLLATALRKVVDAKAEQLFDANSEFQARYHTLEERTRNAAAEEHPYREHSDDQQALDRLAKFKTDADQKLAEIRQFACLLPLQGGGLDHPLISSDDRRRIDNCHGHDPILQIGTDIVYRELGELETSLVEMLNSIAAGPTGVRVALPTAPAVEPDSTDAPVVATATTRATGA